MLQRKTIFIIIFIIFLVLFSISGLVYYIFFTTNGLGFITKFSLSRYIDSRDVDIKSINGSLSEKLTFQDVQIQDIKWLPRGNVLKIQKLVTYFTSFNLRGLNIEISNGRLILPDSETILFYGVYKDGSLDINSYSKYINVKALLDMFLEKQALKNLSGKVKDVDIYVRGTFLEPIITGQVQIEELSRDGFIIYDCPTSFNLSFKDIKEELKIYGEMIFYKGEISGPKTAKVTLKQSKISFNGNPKDPSFDLLATSTVQGTKIQIIFKGTMDKPELRLSSDPAFPQDRLLAMLATNRSWKGTEKDLGAGNISVDLAMDFIDYFLFSGSVSKLAQRLGISDISLTLEEQKKGIGLKKALSDKIDASYSVEQSQIDNKETSTTQKIGGEYKVTETVSLEVERELKQDSKAQQLEGEQKPSDQVILKYKKEF